MPPGRSDRGHSALPAGLRAGGARSRDARRRRGRARRAGRVAVGAGRRARRRCARARPAPATFWPLRRGRRAAMFTSWRGHDRATRGARRGRRRVGVRGRASLAGTGGPSFGVGAALALARAHRLLRARDRAPRRVRRRRHRRDDRGRRSRRCCCCSSSIPVGQALLAAAASTRRGASRRALAVERLFTGDIWGLGCFGGGTRCGVAINSAMLATHRRRAARRLIGLVLALVVQRGGTALRRHRAADVDPADHHAAVRDRARAGRAVRPHRARHGLARRTAFGIPRSRWLYGLPGVDDRAAADVLADRLHDPVRARCRRSARRSRKRRRRCAPRAGACSAP